MKNASIVLLAVVLFSLPLTAADGPGGAACPASVSVVPVGPSGTTTNTATYSWTVTVDGGAPPSGTLYYVTVRKPGMTRAYTSFLSFQPTVNMTLPGGSWEWWVDAVPPSCGQTYKSAVTQIAIPCATTGPALISPPANAVADGETTFEWGAVQSTAVYSVWVRRGDREVEIAATQSQRQAKLHLPHDAEEWWVDAEFVQCPRLSSERRPVNVPDDSVRGGRRRPVPSRVDAQIDVSVTNDDGSPLTEPALVTVDDTFAGRTDQNGFLRAGTMAGSRTVRASIGGARSGSATVTVAPGSTAPVAVVMSEGIATRQVSVDIVEQTGLFLRSNVPAFNFRLRGAGGEPLVPASLVSIDFRTADTELPLFSGIDPTRLFQIRPDGTIAAVDQTRIRSMLAARQGGFRLEVTATDVHGNLLNGSVTVFVARHTLSGTLAAPPSQPDLPVGGVTMLVTYLPTGDSFEVTTAADGTFAAPLLPGGPVSIDREIAHAGRFFYASGVVDVRDATEIRVNLVSDVDVMNGTPAIEIITQDKAAYENDGDPRRQATSAKQAVRPSLGCQLSTITGTRSTAMTQQKTVRVDAGVPELVLKYQVDSEEYPVWVKAQSIYNDQWEVALFAPGGRRLHHERVQVNSQLFSQPLWQAGGTTGEISIPIAIGSYTSSGAANFTLFVSAMNVGDSFYDTAVCAAVEYTKPEIRIVSIVPDAGSVSLGQTTNSIPAAGQINTFHFGYDVRVTPNLTGLSRVKVELLNADSGAVLATVMDRSGTDAQSLKTSDTSLHVFGSYTGPAGYPNSTEPPPTDRTSHRITIFKGDVQASLESPARKALWRMPASLQSRRFGARDAGGDDWSSLNTFKWLANWGALIPQVNDISGEHGRNIGHLEHKYGNDIDVNHIDPILGATASGTDNYYELARRVAASIASGTPDSRVVQWVNATRNGLDSLSDLSPITMIIYGIGSPYTGSGVTLSTGWMRDLIQRGRVGSMTFVSTSWYNFYMSYNSVHDNHIHLRLSH